MTYRPKSIKELVKLFSAMQEFNVQSIEIDGMIIHSRGPFVMPQIYTSELSSNSSDSAAGPVDTQFGTGPQPPSFSSSDDFNRPSYPTTPEELETALNNLGSEWT